MSNYPIGIDLGTTHSCVAVYQHNKIEIISNDHGSRITPSCVSFSEDGQFVGEPALNQASLYPKNTIYDAKRLIGRRYNEETVQIDLNNWPFTVVESKGFPKIQVSYNGETFLHTPEEICSMVLLKMKETAENYLEEKISKVVITVPAYFSDFQKQATINAGKLAGLDAIHILSEPVAAAITYTIEKNNISGTILVFDLGGGTLDVSIVSIHDSHFSVKTTCGDTHLGGQDFTNNLVNYVIELFKKKYNRDLKSNKRAFMRLKQGCENIKRKLSYQNEMRLFIDSIMDGLDINERITRAKFNELNSAEFAFALMPVKKALESANMTSRDIDKIIMAGGSSRIPKIESLLSEFFGGKEILKSINPDEAIAYGAGIYAAIRSGINIQDRSNFLIEDVTPQTLSVGVNNTDEVSVIIPKNSIVPISVTKIFVTIKDRQTILSFPIYEGESNSRKMNTLLGNCTLKGIPPGPKGKECASVTFSVDANRILKVNAVHVATGAQVQTIIDRTIIDRNSIQ